MLDKVKCNLHYLKVLNDGKKAVKQSLIANANENLIKCINECVYNTLYNKNIKLNKTKTKMLKKHRFSLRKLVDKRTSLKKQKKILLQSGGSFLPILLPTVLSVLGELITK